MMVSVKRRVVISALLLAIASVGGVAWRGYGATEPTAGADASRGDRRRDMAVSVTVAKIRIADVPVTVDAVGTVQALNAVTARTQVDGRLLELSFAEGQDVKRGDVLARIDPSLYQAQYDQAVAKKMQDEANLANARLDAARYQKLVAENFASRQQYATQKALVAQLEAQVRADQAAVNNTGATLDYTTIRSQIDGRAGIRQVDVGNIMRAGDTTGIVVVTQIKPIWVVFTVPQQTLPLLRKAEASGQVLVAVLANDNASVIEIGRLAVIDNQIDAQTGTVRVKAEFQNPNLALWPGQFVNVRITVDTLKNALTVPSPAVQRGPNGAFVYLLGDDGTAIMKSVTTGRQDEATAVITTELDVDSKVILSSFNRLSNGLKVRVAEKEDSTATSASGREDEQNRGEKRRRRDAEIEQK